ncbi:MAG: hypothetical protein ABIQ95_09140 [Bdellovibrionia bacterium]
MKNHTQRTKEVRKKVKRSFPHKYKKPLNAAVDHAAVMVTRGIEIFAVLSSLFWAVEATAVQNNQSQNRSLSSLGIPHKKSTANVEFLQYSRLNDAFQSKFQAKPLTLAQGNPALSFKQSPYFVQTQFEFIRFPTFLKK